MYAYGLLTGFVAGVVLSIIFTLFVYAKKHMADCDGDCSECNDKCEYYEDKEEEEE